VADGVRGAVLLASLERVAVVVLEVLRQEVAAALHVHRVGELRVRDVHAGVDHRYPYSLAPGLAPQFVQEDALQGPRAARILAVGEGALVRVREVGRRRGGREEDGGSREQGRGRRGRQAAD
jgi:hypothetical protein